MLNHVYLERTITTNLLMQDDKNFPVYNQVYGGPYPLIDRYIIPPYDINVNKDYITPPAKSTPHSPPLVVQSQDEYFADINEMLAEANRLILEIAVPEKELDIAAVIAESQNDLKNGEI